MNTENALEAGQTITWDGMDACIRLLGDKTAVIDFPDGNHRQVSRTELEANMPWRDAANEAEDLAPVLTIDVLTGQIVSTKVVTPPLSRKEPGNQGSNA